MSNLIHKVKDAIHPHYEHENSDGSQSESVTTSSHISPTKPGILQSTAPGIHGARDAGAHTSLAPSGDGAKLTGSTWGPHAGKSVAGPEASVVHGNTISPTNPGLLDSTKHGIHGLRDTGTGVSPGFEETEQRASQVHADLAAKAAAGFAGPPVTSPNTTGSRIGDGSVAEAQRGHGIYEGGQIGTTTTISGGSDVAGTTRR